MCNIYLNIRESEVNIKPCSTSTGLQPTAARIMCFSFLLPTEFRVHGLSLFEWLAMCTSPLFHIINDGSELAQRRKCLILEPVAGKTFMRLSSPPLMLCQVTQRRKTNNQSPHTYGRKQDSPKAVRLTFACRNRGNHSGGWCIIDCLKWLLWEIYPNMVIFLCVYVFLDMVLSSCLDRQGGKSV